MMNAKEFRIRVGRALFGAGLPMVIVGLLGLYMEHGNTTLLASLNIGQAALAVALIGGGIGLCMPYRVDAN